MIASFITILQQVKDVYVYDRLTNRFVNTWYYVRIIGIVVGTAAQRSLIRSGRCKIITKLDNNFKTFRESTAKVNRNVLRTINPLAV